MVLVSKPTVKAAGRPRGTMVGLLRVQARAREEDGGVLTA